MVTETSTPTSAPDFCVATVSIPAAPAARAITTDQRLGCETNVVRTGSSKVSPVRPVCTATSVASHAVSATVASPAVSVPSARSARRARRPTIAKQSATSGPKSGPTIIAPMRSTTDPVSSPTVAITAERAMKVRYGPSSAEDARARAASASQTIDPPVGSVDALRARRAPSDSETSTGMRVIAPSRASPSAARSASRRLVASFATSAVTRSPCGWSATPGW